MGPRQQWFTQEAFELNLGIKSKHGDSYKPNPGSHDAGCNPRVDDPKLSWTRFRKSVQAGA